MKKLMLAMRAMYAAAIMFFVLQGNWNVVLFHVICFVGSLFVPYLGRDDENYYALDVIVVLTFMLSLFPTYYGAWQRPDTIMQSLYGFDKLFHMAGGAALAMFAAILLRRRTTDKLVVYGGMIIFALALGAAWEFFEWGISVLPEPLGAATSGYADSMIDLVADTLGASLLAVVLKLRRYL